MLDYLGVPYIQSRGEAEATAAALNAHGVSWLNFMIRKLGSLSVYPRKCSVNNILTTKVRIDMGECAIF